MDAYRSTVLNTVPENMGYLSTLPVNSAISVVILNAYCRGGGNRTGLVSLTIPEITYGAENTVRAAQTMQMVRWRGFDNPFGDLYTSLDGIIIDADADNHPNNMNYVYTCQDASKYADTLNDSYVKVGEEIYQDGYTKSFDLGDAAHIIPHVMGGNTTKYICDYH